MNTQFWNSNLLLVSLFPLILGLQLGAVWIVASLDKSLGLPAQVAGRTSPDKLAGASPATANPQAVAAEIITTPARRDIPLRRNKNLTRILPDPVDKIPLPLALPPGFPNLSTMPAITEQLSASWLTGMQTATDAAFPQRKGVQSQNVSALKSKESQIGQMQQKPTDPPNKASAAAEQAESLTKLPASAIAMASELQEPPWLQAQDPNRYTLQLYKSRDLDSLMKFARSNPLPQPLAYYHMIGKSGAWYILVGGDYSNESTAQAALVALNGRLPKLRVWLCDFGEIQAQLR